MSELFGVLLGLLFLLGIIVSIVDGVKSVANDVKEKSYDLKYRVKHSSKTIYLVKDKIVDDISKPLNISDPKTITIDEKRMDIFLGDNRRGIMRKREFLPKDGFRHYKEYELYTQSKGHIMVTVYEPNERICEIYIRSFLYDPEPGEFKSSTYIVSNLV